MIDRILFILSGLFDVYVSLPSKYLIRRVKLLGNQTGILHFLAHIDWNEFGFEECRNTSNDCIHQGEP